MTNADSLKSAASNPTAVTSLHLVNIGLDEFPSEIFACTNLEELRLSSVLKWDERAAIADQFESFPKLERLHLTESIRRLPASIASLRQLQTLDLDRCSKLEELPSSIGQLGALVHLVLTHCSSLRSLPDSVAKLKSLQTLNIAGQSMRLNSVGAELYTLPNLQLLRLPGSIERLPPGISALGTLKELWLSASALHSIAAELPGLRQLERLHVSQQTDRLPDEICALGNLKELNLYGVRLQELPRELVKLEKLQSLNLNFNKITTLRWLVEKLPALQTLSFEDTSVPKGEKQAIKALMKLPANERGAQAAKAAPKPKKVAAPRVKPNTLKPLGTIASINASLCVVVADAELARHYRGIQGGVGDELTGSDWQRVHDAMQEQTNVSFVLSTGQALAFDLGQGQGTAAVFAHHDGGLVIVESFAEDDELREVARRPRDADAKDAGQIEVSSGALVLTPSIRQLRAGEGNDQARQSESMWQRRRGPTRGANAWTLHAMARKRTRRWAPGPPPPVLKRARVRAEPRVPRPPRVQLTLMRLTTSSSTTLGSASVVVSPRLPSSFSAILRRMRRMILPERVFGKPGAH